MPTSNRDKKSVLIIRDAMRDADVLSAYDSQELGSYWYIELVGEVSWLLSSHGGEEAARQYVKTVMKRFMVL